MADYEIGRFRLSLEYRRVDSDEGPTLHLFGPAGGNDEEVLRFDCFRSEPHYHLGWSYWQEPFVRIAADEPFDWSVEQLTTDPNALLQAAAAETMNEQECQRLQHLKARLLSEGRELVRVSC